MTPSFDELAKRIHAKYPGATISFDLLIRYYPKGKKNDEYSRRAEYWLHVQGYELNDILKSQFYPNYESVVRAAENLLNDTPETPQETEKVLETIIGETK